jgi:hypothetical protein
MKKIKVLKQRADIDENAKLNTAYNQFENLISELTNKELPSKIVDFINVNIEELNLISAKELKNQLRKRQAKIIMLLEKELKIVPKNHYRNTWLAIGMAAFGIPFGVAFGAILGNMAFLGIGLPIGMVIGIAVGTGMDKKAFDEGRQLEVDLE